MYTLKLDLSETELEALHEAVHEKLMRMHKATANVGDIFTPSFQDMRRVHTEIHNYTGAHTKVLGGDEFHE